MNKEKVRYEKRMLIAYYADICDVIEVTILEQSQDGKYVKVKYETGKRTGVIEWRRADSFLIVAQLPDRKISSYPMPSKGRYTS